jgi:hypothetical protein
VWESAAFVRGEEESDVGERSICRGRGAVRVIAADEESDGHGF